MSSNKVTGLCAPTVVQRKVRGCIFDLNCKHERYYLAHGCGGTDDKSKAYVFTCAEAITLMAEHVEWANKRQGKWILMYE